MIVFDHLRKTGGTSVRWMLARQLNHAFFYAGDVTYDFTVQPRRGLQFICGHDQFGTMESDASTFLFTFLRHPVDVVYSAAHAHHRNLTRAGKRPARRDRFVARRVAAILDDEESLHWTWRTRAHWRDLDLARYDFVGVQEEMETSLARLGRCLGLELAGERRNVAPGSHRHRRDELERHFAAEIELWRQARHRLLGAASPSRLYDLSTSRKVNIEHVM